MRPRLDQFALYFAYGSNLNRRQMKERCPGAEVVGRGVLVGYELVFGGHSVRWGGGVASVVKRRGSMVQGVLYLIPIAELALLDRYEGAPRSYARLRLRIVDEAAKPCQAFVYMQPAERFRTSRAAPRYYRTIQRAYASWGLDSKLLARAVGGLS